MKILQSTLKATQPDLAALDPLRALAPQLVLAFADPDCVRDPARVQSITALFPQATVVGCSTAGEIDRHGAQDKTVVLTAVRFDAATVRATATSLSGMADSRAAGVRLARAIAQPGLKAVLVFGQGVDINGSAWVEGMTEVLGCEVPLVGGLAGDAGAFVGTWTLGPDGPSSHALVAVGLYGDALHVGYGSFGGWQPFGPARRVTRCDGNVLYELDGEPALDVYKRYLGDYARDLPASGLLFPFAMLDDDRQPVGLIRTILGVDEAQGSLTLAGEINPGGSLKLMHASTEALVDGAENAARMAWAGTPVNSSLAPATLALLVSCVGRKLVMGDRVDEEVEAVAEILGPGAVLAGFYSYGEISPFAPAGACKLHNQTMTITTLCEA